VQMQVTENIKNGRVQNYVATFLLTITNLASK